MPFIRTKTFNYGAKELDQNIKQKFHIFFILLYKTATNYIISGPSELPQQTN